jgi:HTH-type transcriptional regulator / antitoxin HigA
MITNERQYKITKSQLGLLQKAIVSFDIKNKTQQIGSELLAVAEFEALKSEVEVLENQVKEYETLKSGAKFTLTASSLAELPKILIQARIVQNLSQKELALLLGLKEQQIQRYEAEDYQSASLKRLLEVATALKLNVSGIAEINRVQDQPTSSSKDTVDWSKFPIKEMYKRGWFEGFSGSIDDAIQARVELIQNYVSQIFKKPALGLHRKHIRANSNLDEYALLAWECRVLHLATKVTVCQYKKELLTPEWISQLVKLSRFQDGPRRAMEMLEQAGIILIIEPMLPNTYLDGAAILHGDTPVIGLTLRYDRLDNFWFVLLHEIYHVIKHLGKGKVERIFDDLDVSNAEKLEREADDLAGESLIPTLEWDKAIARFTRSTRSINDLANKLGISPAIIAGRIRHEANNYIILNDLIGQGGVRNQFPDAIFGI